MSEFESSRFFDFKIMPMRAIPCGPSTAIENCWKCRRVKERCRCDRGSEVYLPVSTEIVSWVNHALEAYYSPPSGVRRFVSGDGSLWLEVDGDDKCTNSCVGGVVGKDINVDLIKGWGWTEVPASSSGTGI